MANNCCSAIIASPRRSAIVLGIMLPGLAGLFLEKAFDPRNTQMNANGKEVLLYLAKLWECDTSSCRFRSNAAAAEKRCEDAPHSKSALRESVFRFVSTRVVREQQDFLKAP